MILFYVDSNNTSCFLIQRKCKATNVVMILRPCIVFSSWTSFLQNIGIHTYIWKPCHIMIRVIYSLQCRVPQVRSRWLVFWWLPFFYGVFCSICIQWLFEYGKINHDVTAQSLSTATRNWLSFVPSVVQVVTVDVSVNCWYHNTLIFYVENQVVQILAATGNLWHFIEYGPCRRAGHLGLGVVKDPIWGRK
jgi:hypothetical protein